MAFENQALWHERDISHSSVERVIAPDATSALDFAIKRMNDVVVGLEVDEKQMALHVEQTKGAIFSESVLLALVAKGVLRQEAYGYVQAAAKRQSAEAISFERALIESAEVKKHLSSEEILKACDVQSHLKHVDEMFARLK
jgi:adenylosuccinate lyase